MKPLIKWVGGKTQILPELLSHFPTAISGDYYEPFVGGGSVLFTVLAKGIVRGRVKACDKNEALIRLYQNVQRRPTELYAVLREMADAFLALTESDRKVRYYELRQQYNDIDSGALEASALFILLNKTCFRGIFRQGPNGFNVPYGNNKNPEVINRQHLEEVSALLQPVEFIHGDFVEVLNDIKPGDFVYMDPPYAPETATSFVGYTVDGFDHMRLFQTCAHLIEKNVSFVMSNANVPIVLEHVGNLPCQIDTLVCRRAINSKNPGAKTTEIIATFVATTVTEPIKKKRGRPRKST